jgi:hypothetical protein
MRLGTKNDCAGEASSNLPDRQTRRQQGDLTNYPLFFRNEESRLRMDIEETGCVAGDWIHISQSRDQLWTPANTIRKFSGFRERQEIS